ncbi:hypothetical protein A2U01_0048898 [Trifolium medium]|uniref:Uncharacterized protein n=1 Tax=Trifolium medium TaxID=97028 RepID=A0A392QTT1_9FABA|nr:hypothetical protein [Trifolium medium]
MYSDPPGGCDDRVVRTSDSPQISGAQVSHTIRQPPVGPGREAGAGESEGIAPLRSKRTKSCPPIAKRSVISGPWSLD